jgi:hypothetical protein
MLDYAAWTRRVSAFLRRLTRLPGAISIGDEIEPPDAERCALSGCDSSQATLPCEIRRFLATASRRCAFHYEWTPPQQHRGLLAELFPGRLALCGGGDLCEAAKYDPGVAEFREDLESLFASLGLKTPTDLRKTPIAGEKQSCRRVTLMELENGDTISLDEQATDRPWAVVYIEKARLPNARILSSSFEQFLLDWETLCYVGPEIWLLGPFLADGGDGPLLVKQPKATLWRRVMLGLASQGQCPS